MPMRWWSMLAIGGTIGLAAGVAIPSHGLWEQPPPPRPGTGEEPPPGPHGGPDGPGGQREPGQRRRFGSRFPDDPASAKAMLERWITDMDKRRTVFQEAIKRLDSGESIDEVRAFVREASPPLPWTLIAGTGRNGEEGAGAGSEDPRVGNRKPPSLEPATPEGATDHHPTAGSTRSRCAGSVA